MSVRGIKDQRVILTAGGSGIGRAIADLLIENGAKVHICDIADDFLDKFAKDHPNAGVTKADVSSEADVARLFADAADTLGGLDAMINNAGDTATGNSRCGISDTTATTNTLPLRIVSLVEETKNSSGGFTEALVKWNAGHQMNNLTGV